ncbi:hypothetical protein [Sulfitobacter sp.]|uniref:hypothetical protein n=1 Tax=Sulfitobacter sp. TaxID=1903071 RepID=UPI003EF9D115
MAGKTFFGLEIVSNRGVRRDDIACLPFADFWCESAFRSGQIKDTATGEWLVHLHDWETFSQLFVATGRHRNMPRPPEVLWFDREDDEPERTYFGLEIQDNLYVLPSDIERLPFYAFWCAYAASKRASPALTTAALIHLEDWSTFAKGFITSGPSILSANSNRALKFQNLIPSKER